MGSQLVSSLHCGSGCPCDAEYTDGQVRSMQVMTTSLVRAVGIVTTMATEQPDSLPLLFWYAGFSTAPPEVRNPKIPDTPRLKILLSFKGIYKGSTRDLSALGFWLPLKGL